MEIKDKAEAEQVLKDWKDTPFDEFLKKYGYKPDELLSKVYGDVVPLSGRSG